MVRLTTLALIALALAACDDPDAAPRGDDPAPAHDVERTAPAPDLETVRLDTTAWFTEGRVVEFDGRSWSLVGEPVFDPSVQPVGEFEGTPLYADTGATPPTALYIPVGGDYWQRLERATTPDDSS